LCRGGRQKGWSGNHFHSKNTDSAWRLIRLNSHLSKYWSKLSIEDQIQRNDLLQEKSFFATGRKASNFQHKQECGEQIVKLHNLTQWQWDS
jgi:hypothetical protein